MRSPLYYIISLHMPLLESTYHLVNKEGIQKMKDGVIIINCARGELADMNSMIEGIESGKIGALGLDVVEGLVTMKETGTCPTELKRKSV